MIFRKFSLIISVFFIIVADTVCQNDQPSKSWLNLSSSDSLVIENLSVNSKYDDFSPVLINGTLYFSSARTNRHTDEADLKFNHNVYTSIAEETNWQSPLKHYFFNNDDFTSIAGFSHHGPVLYVYKTFGNGDLYYSETSEKGKWKAPRRFGSPVNSPFNEQSIAVTDKLIVISSNRENPEHHDLYWGWYFPDIKQIEFSLLHQANTNGNELDVSFSSDGKTLYFSSDGRKKENDFDIYSMKIDEKGNWSQPENFGEIVNTSSNERWFMDCDSMFFFSSDRTEGSGGMDIFRGHILQKAIKDTIPEIIEDTVILVELPDTQVYDPIEKINEYLDSIQFEVYVAYVQIGAFYFIKSVEVFQSKFSPFATTDIFIEKVETEKGTLHKFIINQQYKTLAEASVRQKDALEKQAETNRIHSDKLREDAFIAVYDMKGDRILIYFNVETKEYKILIGDKTVYF